ncbi:sugar phosphate isomerase/epimerase family protein [uncultured Paludibaculum sp.]|uniref:sugar phosphate isomerase/epimerase family protein n=1 Tax=uncultured Paludibaculum sp. TaxID=1765020 RepID=UPI002AAA70FE|nr:sugar phosphate isomerase/epimerase family protein [uncultured Paludibaculum sp.]
MRINRRALLQAAAVGAALPARAAVQSPIRLGIVVWVRKGETADAVVGRVKKLGFPTCQIGFEDLKPRDAVPLKAALQAHGVEATALLELGPGRMVWDFRDGPLTIGLVPRATRRARIDVMKLAADVASGAGIPAIHTHCGFIPENLNDPVYAETVAAVKEVAVYCASKGRTLLFETGQESPITLLRLMRDVGTKNLGVNLDTANLILYGKGNPVDAMDVIGKYVKGLHAKDGRFPTDPWTLGEETPIGQGKVDFRGVIRRLKEVQFHGAMTIEREVEGDQQTKDILASKAYLEKLIVEVYGS